MNSFVTVTNYCIFVYHIFLKLTFYFRYGMEILDKKESQSYSKAAVNNENHHPCY